MAVRQYIGARYTVKTYQNSNDPASAEWEAGVSYERMVLVTYNNSSFVSKTEVPANIGNPVDNPQYWLIAFNTSGQVVTLQNKVAALQENENCVTFEHFGAVGDGITDDTVAINAAIAYASSTGIALSSKGKTYKITGNITFLSGVNAHHLGSIISTSGNTVTVNQYTVIDDVCFEGIKVYSSAYTTQLRHVTIKGVTSGNALHITAFGNDLEYDKTKNTMLFDDILIYNDVDSTATGVYIDSPDVHLHNVEVVNCLIGFRVRQNCRLFNCNVWVNNVITDFDNTVGYKIDGTAVRLIGCTADTMKLAIKMPSQYYNMILEGFQMLFNSDLKSNTDFTFINYYGQYRGSVIVNLAGMAGAGNRFFIGYQSGLSIDYNDGQPSDFRSIMYSATADHNGTVSQLIIRRMSEFYKVKMLVNFTPGNLLTTDTLTITLPFNFSDAAGFTNAGLNRYIVKTIFNSSGGELMGFRELQFTAGDTMKLYNHYSPAGASSVKEIEIDLTIPVALDSI